MNAEPWAVVLILLACVIGSFGALYFKLGSKSLSFKVKDLLKNRFLILGFIFYCTSAVFFIFGLKGGDLSVLYPLAATSYIWVALLSKKFLKEDITKYKIIGIALIIIGVCLVGFGS